MSEPLNPRFIGSRHWVTLAVFAVCILVLAALVIPAILNARMAAWRTQSKNNLKQLGLALHNYHDTYEQFPIGADIGVNGTAKHGWTIRLVPYIEASNLYSLIELNDPWDGPFNAHLFRFKHSGFANPAISEVVTTDGFGLMHYSGNPNVLHRNSTISMDQMTTGTSHNWLVGEIGGNYQPWAYPFNWRVLNDPLSQDAESFGFWRDGGQFCVADGSVKLLTNDTDKSIIEALANAPPVATADETWRPPRQFEYSSSSHAPNRVLLRADVEVRYSYKGAPGTTIHFDASGEPYSADVYSSASPEFTVDGTRIDVVGTAEQFPELRVLIARGFELTDSNVETISKFRDLESLLVWRIALTPTGIATLKTLPKLKDLKCMADAATRDLIIKSFPAADVQL